VAGVRHGVAALQEELVVDGRVALERGQKVDDAGLDLCHGSTAQGRPGSLVEVEEQRVLHWATLPRRVFLAEVLAWTW